MQLDLDKVTQLYTTPRTVSDGRFDEISLGPDYSIFGALKAAMGYKNAEIEAKSREAAKTMPISAVVLVQSSSMYGIALYSADNPQLQRDAETLYRAAAHLYSFKDQPTSSDPKIAHIQHRLTDESNMFAPEPIDPAVVDGLQGMWWSVESVSGMLPEGYEREHPLYGFIKPEADGSISLKLLEGDFYGKYLV